MEKETKHGRNLKKQQPREREQTERGRDETATTIIWWGFVRDIAQLVMDRVRKHMNLTELLAHV